MIPLLDLKAQYRNLKSELDAAVIRVMENAQFILGPEVAAFEKEFAAYCDADQALGLNSGTSALHLALLAAGIGAGDEVITTPFTFIATAAAIVYTGATPVFVDIEPDTFNIDVTKLEAAITARTRAIIPVHLFGQPADLDPIERATALEPERTGTVRKHSARPADQFLGRSGVPNSPPSRPTHRTRTTEGQNDAR